MRPQLLMFCYGVFAIGLMLSCIISGRWLINGEVNLINALHSFNAVEIQAGGGWSIAKTLGDYWNALVTMLSWKYPYLDNPWGMTFKIIFLYPISLGVIFGFIQMLSVAMTGVVSAVRSLLPGGS